ncbi:MFS transporter [Ramlibacter sp. RBP-2]|uniref:MFS transporter n=1 Tax=Ramlibacter lithotrophicus TaxID=2606681 RepID=A0A7X6DG10_9BURK|nr:MFS transporter [Ramlibacter lithotrophicus]NKE66477.1 MFS transporter [Ramlibacter lithotrophicus]
MRTPPPALIVVLAGVAAALHVGKLAPALPVLSVELGVTLVQAGFLLSLVQLAGMALGVAAGLAADGLGLKRTMAGGLALLSLASVAGGWARDPYSLMALRAVEGAGFLLAAMPAPGLIRRLVDPSRVNPMLGLWGAYMPLGTAAALLIGPMVIAASGWPGWWWLLALVSAGMAAWLWVALPADPRHAAGGGPVPATRQSRLGQTLSAPGPWLVALAFAAYSSQWLAVIGFLPTMYAQAGLGTALAGAATALAAVVNMAGNVASGRLLQRGVPAQCLLYLGFAAMGLGAFVAFAPLADALDPPTAGALRYAAVLLFSAVGGLIPGTLFSLAVRLAPAERAVSTTVGWMQQCSSLGQFAGPPLVGWVAARAGGWHWSWLVTGGCSLAGILLAWATGTLLRRRVAGGTTAGRGT